MISISAMRTYHRKKTYQTPRESRGERRQGLCREETEQDPVARARGQEEVWAEAVKDRAAVAAGGAVLEQARGAIASAPTAASE